MEPCLYIVATPIGNLDDITIRAKEVLSNVSVIAAEDTRHTRRLLNHLGITAHVRAYHDFSSNSVARKLLDEVKNGGSVALVSDAGTPLISDPGYVLVEMAHELGIRVVPVPGVSAVIAMLSTAGIPSDRFSFEGFLPSKSQQRLNTLNELRYEARTIIFYEVPHRIEDSLKAMVEVFGGERVGAIGRELTKTFETITKAPLRELLAFTSEDSNQQRGEIVVAVKGYQRACNDISDESKRLFAILAGELPPKKVAKLVSEYTGDSTKQIYQWSLTR